jgi:hypothetical protein
MSLNNEPPESIRKLMEVADHVKYLKHNFLKYSVQRNDAGGTLWEAINNAWIRNNIACHLHVELEARGPNLHTHHLCILIHKRVVGPRLKWDHIRNFVPEALEKLRKVGVPVGKHCYRGYHLVFVVVGELAEPRQGMQEHMPLVEVTLVGLMLIDDYPVLRSELVERPVFKNVRLSVSLGGGLSWIGNWMILGLLGSRPLVRTRLSCQTRWSRADLRLWAMSPTRIPTRRTASSGMVAVARKT